jgi:MFS transporter, DHA2 family, multidrug resistance protein
VNLLLAHPDATITLLTTATVTRDVHASPAASIWVANACQPVVIISLLPLSS